jgi:uncharacterized protein (DUF2235 family)
MRLLFCRTLEAFFRRLENFARDAGERFAVCPDCGRNRYTGQPFKNLN